MIKYSGYQNMTFKINHETYSTHVKPSETLLHVLRDKLGLTGTKGSCENGDCGACTVLIDGQPMKSCMVLAVACEQADIMTIEGLEDTEIQQAFVDFNGFQCGYCTSGFLMNAYAMLESNPEISEEDQKVWLDSNLCRCTGYEGIRDAVNAAKRMKK
jgi:carbon-monoxide dehydrogenase small subunit